MFQQFEGIVLRARSYGESNQIVTIFTNTMGKRVVMARGSKKTRSRLGSVTEPFTKAAFVCYGKKGMPTLSQGDLIEGNQHVRSSLLLTAYVSYWFDLLDRLTHENEPNEPIYSFYNSALQRIVDTDADILTRMIELRMLEHAGYRPQFHSCVSCGVSGASSFFDVRQGGVLCDACNKEGMEITQASIRVLGTLQIISPHQIGKINLKMHTMGEMERVLDVFMKEYLNVEFKSKRILKHIQDVELA